MLSIIWNALLAEWETFAIIAVAAVLFIYLKAEKPTWHALAIFGVYFASVALQDLWRMIHIQTQADKDLAYEIWAIANHGSFTISDYVIFFFLLFPPKQKDTLAIALAFILIVSATWTALVENIGCNFVLDDIPFELQTPEQREMSRCERITGKWMTFVPIALQLMAVLYFGRRWHQARKEAELTAN